MMTAEPDDITDEVVENAPQADRADRRWRKRLGYAALALVASMFVLVAGGGVYLSQRSEPLQTPDWMHNRVQMQINKTIAPYASQIGSTAVSLDENYVPRVLLRDVTLQDVSGAGLVVLDDVEVQASRSALMRGQFQPKAISLAGIRLSLRRDAKGSYWLSFAEALNTGGQGRSFAELMAGVDAVFARSGLESFTKVEASDVTLRYEDERARRAWTVDGGRLELARNKNDLAIRADFALLTGGAEAAGVELNFTSPIGEATAVLGMNLTDFPARDLASQSAALSWLEALRAPISGALRVTMDEAGELGPLSATLQISAGVLQPNDSTQPIPFETARTYLTYNPSEQIIQFDEIALQSEWVTLRAGGKLGLVTNDTGWPTSFVGQLRFENIAAEPGAYLSDKVTFDRGHADLQLSLDPFRINLGQLDLADGETRIHAEGQFDALNDGWSYQVQAGATALELDQVMRLWPPLLSARTRDWVVKNVSRGRIDEAQFGLQSTPDQKPAPYLAFSYSDVDLRFMKTMPIIEAAAGQASLFNKRFAARAVRGTIKAPQGGRLDVAGTEFIIPETKRGGALAQVNVAAKGRITALLSLLDRDPLNLISKAKQSVTMADGSADVNGLISWVMQKNVPTDQVKFDVAGTLENVRSSSLVPERILASNRLSVTANNDALKISGDGRLDSVPVSGTFTVPIGKGTGAKSRIQGRVELSDQSVKAFNIGLPSGTVSGRGSADVEITLAAGKSASFALTSSLAGVGLEIPQIGWRKPASSKGRLSVSGALGKPLQIDNISIATAGLDANGDVLFSNDGVFTEARFTAVKIGDWLNVPLRFVSRGRKRSPAIVISGGRLDLSKTTFGESNGGSGKNGGGPISAQLNELKISDGIALKKFKGEFDGSKGFEGRFTGLVNGQAPVAGRVVAQGKRNAFQVSSDNGGQVLAAAGLLKNASGGALTLTLAPASAEGVYNGALDLTNVRLRDAPAMAELLNAASIIGLLEQLSGKGILFSEVEARFQLTPKQVIVSRSSAVGTSMGISMDGYYNLASGAMDMQGVVSPFFVLNGIGSIFTRKGEGLVGFNYKLRGSATSPKVQVNPLSLFTPGMFREIFRRPPPEVDR